MTSQDVIHSFYVPAFRFKQDVLPGRYTTLWFKATVPGRYHLFCAEYCGTMHSGMGGDIVVMEPQDYAQWMAGGATRAACRIPARSYSRRSDALPAIDPTCRVAGRTWKGSITSRCCLKTAAR